MIENNKGLYVIPKTSDRGGASILYTSENGSTEWLLDVLTGYEVRDLNTDMLSMYLAGTLVDTLVVTGSTRTGVVVTVVRMDLIGGDGVIDAESTTDDAIAVAEAHYETGYSQGLLTRTEASLNVNTNNELELQVRAYFKLPPSDPTSDDTFHVVGYTWVDFFDNSSELTRVYNEQIQLADLPVIEESGGTRNIGDTEKLVSVQTLHKKLSYGGATYSYVLPIIITDLGIYLVITEYNKQGYLFSGNTVELQVKEQSYQNKFFGTGATTTLVTHLVTAAVSAFITPEGILTLELPGDGQTRVNFIKLDLDLPTILGLSTQPEATAYFTTTLKYVTEGRTSTSVITPEDVANKLPRLIASVGDNKYLRVNHTIFEINTKAARAQVTVSTTFGRDSFSPVTFAVNESGGILEVKENGIFTHSELANADTGMEVSEEDITPEEREAYTTKQEYTKVYLDPEAISEEHQVLMGTTLDSDTEEVLSSIISEEITGEYSSDFGYSFLTSKVAGGSTATRSILVYGVQGESGAQLLSTSGIHGVLVSGTDFVTHGIRRTIIMCVDNDHNAWFYCFLYTGEQPRLVQKLQVPTSGTDGGTLIGDISAIQDSSGDVLIVHTESKIFLAEVAAFGIVVNGEDTFVEILDSSAEDEIVTGSIRTLEAYIHPSMGVVLCIASGSQITTYIYSQRAISLVETASVVGVSVRGLQAIIKKEEPILIVWGDDSEFTYLRTYNIARPWAPTLITEETFDTQTPITSSKFAVTVAEAAQVTTYRANRSLSKAGQFPVTAEIASLFGECVLTVAAAGGGNRYQVEGRRWWAGLRPEVCYDSSRLEYKVPIYSVDYEDDPIFYDRTVLERDTIYHEPVTVAYLPTSTRRAKKVISNRRLAFKRGSAVGGGLEMLRTTKNTRKLLRNSVMWCLDVDPTTLVSEVVTPEEVTYLPSPKVDPQINDVLSMEALPVCVNQDYIGKVLESIPESGIFIDASYLPGAMKQGVFFENKIVNVYAREQVGTSQLRVEFGEYRDPGASDTTGYTSPGLGASEQESGIVSIDGTSAFRFWHELWEQSKKTGQYLSQLLDLREVAVGPAKVSYVDPTLSDITHVVNPAKLLLTHLLADSVITVIRIKERTEVDTSTLIQEAKADLDRVPWLQINKTLPANSKCVTVYVVESNNSTGSKTITPDSYND